jgi:hypothetical protein
MPGLIFQQQVSIDQSSISLSLSLPEYLVFVLTGSLWGRVDFYCKELTPYSKMRQGSTTADQSILLDYINPILPTSFWKALRYRHWAVVVSIACYAILKLCVCPQNSVSWRRPAK